MNLRTEPEITAPPKPDSRLIWILDHWVTKIETGYTQTSSDQATYWYKLNGHKQVDGVWLEGCLRHSMITLQLQNPGRLLTVSESVERDIKRWRTWTEENSKEIMTYLALKAKYEGKV
jgi:hypothetical protein